MAQNLQPETGDETVDPKDGAPMRSAPPGGVRRLWRRYQGLTLGARLGFGFAAAFIAVVVAAAAGLAFMQAVLLGMENFSRRADLTAAAAELEIGLSNLEIAVRDHLAEGDGDSYADAARQRETMIGKIKLLLEAARKDDAKGEDAKAAAAAQAALDTYWNGFERIVALKAQRAEITEQELPRLSAALQGPLERLKNVGGVDSAAIVAEAAAKAAAAQDMGLRFTERHDMMDGQRAQNAFNAARDRLVELNRYRWSSGTVENMAEAAAALDALEKTLDRLDGLAVQQDAIRADALAPYAAAIVERARELRGSAEREVKRLRVGLAERATDYAQIALWAAGAVLLLGGLTAAAAHWSVVRPVRAAARALTALQDDSAAALAVPDFSVDDDRRDEAAELMRATAAVRGDAARLRRSLSQAEAERDQLAAQLRQVSSVNAAKSDFLVNMSHLLHGPLNDMTAQAQNLMSELHRNGLVDCANDAETLQWTAERLTGRLDALMDYARIEAGRGELCLQDFDVARLVVETRERAAAQADLHGLTLTASSADDVGGMHSDFAKVRQALLNLLENACLHSGGAVVRLAAERAARDGRSWVVFTVADDGAGIPVDRAAAMFRPFVRGTAANGKSAGLGLSLTAHYAAMLGGELEVTTAPGRGLRIALLLPAVFAAEDETRPLRARIGAPGERLGPPQLLLSDAPGNG